jgi:hypothetical protein
MDEKTRKLIELATVPIRSEGVKPGEGGQGVYIGNNYVLTAAHCLEYDTQGGIIMEDYPIYYIDRPEGDPLWCSPVCIDPCSDLAVVGPCDSQASSKHFLDFLGFFEDLVPIRIRRDPLPLDEAVKIEIRTHLGTWVTGRMEQCTAGSPFAFLDTDENILGGTSGGPIVDEDGNIVSIVSCFGGSDGETTTSRNSIPSLWLPPWLLASVPGDE